MSATDLMENLAEGTTLLRLGSSVLGRPLDPPRMPSAFQAKANIALFLTEMSSKFPRIQFFVVADLTGAENYPLVAKSLVQVIESMHRPVASAVKKIERAKPKMVTPAVQQQWKPKPVATVATSTPPLPRPARRLTKEKAVTRVPRSVERDYEETESAPIAREEMVVQQAPKKKPAEKKKVRSRRKIKAIESIPEIKARGNADSKLDKAVEELLSSRRYSAFTGSLTKQSDSSYLLEGVRLKLSLTKDGEVVVERGSGVQSLKAFLARRHAVENNVVVFSKKPVSPSPMSGLKESKNSSNDSWDETEHLRNLLSQMML